MQINHIYGIRSCFCIRVAICGTFALARLCDLNMRDARPVLRIKHGMTSATARCPGQPLMVLIDPRGGSTRIHVYIKRQLREFAPRGMVANIVGDYEGV